MKTLQEQFKVHRNEDAKRWEFKSIDNNSVSYTVGFHEAETEEDAYIVVWKASRKNLKYIGVSTISDYDEFTETISTTTYGYKITDGNEKNYARDGKLYLDGTEIDFFGDFDLLKQLPEGKTLKFYCIREVENSRFVCGLDIVDGGYWNSYNDTVYPSLQDVLNLFDKAVYVCIESEMQI